MSTDKLLELDRAARLAGVPEEEILQDVDNGFLHVVRGKLRLVELRRRYPDIDDRRSTMVEVTQQIRWDAQRKGLARKVSQSQGAKYTELKDAYAQTKRDERFFRDKHEDYRAVILQLRNMVVDLEKRLEPKQRPFAKAILSWIDKKVR